MHSFVESLSYDAQFAVRLGHDSMSHPHIAASSPLMADLPITGRVQKVPVNPE